MKRICIVTGARSEYGILKLLIKKIEKSKNLKLLLLVTGIHLLERYGKTINQIKKDNIPITKIIPMYKKSEEGRGSLGKAIGKAIKNFSNSFLELKPDILLVLGDRYEPLAAVIAASTLSIPIGHIHGGDKINQGQVDEQIRHAITKFSHIHFPATKKSAKRIRLMGEENWRIHMVGSPSIDLIYKKSLLNKEKICEKLNLNSEKTLALLIHHPYIFESEQAGSHMKLILEILKKQKIQTVIIYPNNDPGSHSIIQKIQEYKDTEFFTIFKNLDRKDYLSLLKNIDFLIGNSSSGLIESAIFNLPVINIGKRNKGRESGKNVINVPYNMKAIQEAISKALSPQFRNFCKTVKNPYGDGKASQRIVKILNELDIDKKLLVKKLDYNI